MRRVARNLILGIVAVLVLLLALGALPEFLGSGDPYYVTATPTDDASDNVDSVGSTNLSERSYPYTTGALTDASETESGRSDPYQRGPVGFKEAFTHSPFDEVNALRQNYPNATVDEGVIVARNGTLYRVAVTR